MEPKVKKPVTAENALIRLETLCARAEHCTYELRQKLYRWGIEGAEANRIISSLEARKFVDDERFARAYVKDKLNFARWGSRKIAYGLKTKRIPDEIIRKVLDEADTDTENDNLSKILKAKLAGIKESDSRKVREKLIRFAIGRGYSFEAVIKSINSLESDI